MKLVFIGNPLPHKLTDWKQYKTLHASQAGNVAQCDIIDGLVDLDPNLTVITRSPNGRWAELTLDNGVKAIGVSNINVSKPLYYLSIMPGEFTSLRRVVRSSVGQKIVIVSHNLPPFVGLPIILIKRFYKNVLWVPYLIDPIVYIYKFPLGLISKLSAKMIKHADALITYVSHSATDYVPNLPFTKVFFTIDSDLLNFYRTQERAKCSKPTIAYTGALISNYMLEIIIESIRKTGKTYRWVFCGNGEFADQLEGLSKDKANFDVDFYGIVSREKAAQIQSSADLLLCIRGGKGFEYQSRYAASGKSNEYLASGTPTLCTDVPAIPEEIKAFFTMMRPDDITADSLCAELHRIFEENHYMELLNLAKRGQEFAFENFTVEKNNTVINRFIQDLVD